MSLDRTALLAALSPQPFPEPPTDSQAAGLSVILDAWEVGWPGGDLRWLAYALGTAHHETAATLRPVREIGRGAGKPYGLADPRTGLAYYGRGFVQLTWARNYAAMGERLDLDLQGEPDLALQPQIAARILLTGMSEGLFSGVGLTRYFNVTVEDWLGARRIVNGADCAQKVAAYARAYLAALSRSD